MDKEINTHFLQIQLNFFYDDFELSQYQIEEYQKVLLMLAKSINNFKETELKLNDYSCVLNINLSTDVHIQELNSEYRKKNRITDVLSFPLQDNLRSDQFDKILPEIQLGDIFICHSVCKKQAVEFNISFMDEFTHLATHGFLHLLGFDHEISSDEEKLMQMYEQKIIESASCFKE